MENLWAAVKSGAASGILAGGYGFADNNWYVGANAPAFGRRANSIQDAITAASSKDVIFLGPQAHVEGNIIIPASKPNLTIVGMGNRGACFIEPSVAGDEGLQVLADDTTLINVGVADGGSGDYGLSVGSADVSPDRFRAYGCKFEGSAIGARLYGAGDVLLDDCEFAWAAIGLQLRSNLVGFNTQIFMRESRFHNNADASLGQFAAAQQVNNLEVQDCIFDNAEDGTAPTFYVQLADNLNTGIIAKCMFAVAAAGFAAKYSVGTGIHSVDGKTAA